MLITNAQTAGWPTSPCCECHSALEHLQRAAGDRGRNVGWLAVSGDAPTIRLRYAAQGPCEVPELRRSPDLQR